VLTVAEDSIAPAAKFGRASSAVSMLVTKVAGVALKVMFAVFSPFTSSLNVPPVTAELKFNLASRGLGDPNGVNSIYRVSDVKRVVSCVIVLV